MGMYRSSQSRIQRWRVQAAHGRLWLRRPPMRPRHVPPPSSRAAIAEATRVHPWSVPHSQFSLLRNPGMQSLGSGAPHSCTDLAWGAAKACSDALVEHSCGAPPMIHV
eukprot:7377073-Prymnesium_polylepis.1